MKKTLFLSAILATALCSSAFAETYTIENGTSVTYAAATFADYTDIDVYGTLDTNAQTISQNITLRDGATLGNVNTSCWGLGNKLTGSILLEGNSFITGKGVNFGGEMNLNGNTLTIKDMTDAGVYFRDDSSITGTGKISVQSRTLQFRDSSITATNVTLDISGGSVEVRSAHETTLAGVTGTSGSTLKSGDYEGTSVLKLAGADDYSFAGTVVQDSATRKLTINHTGTGTQTFSGTVKSGTFLASAGTMKLTGSISPEKGTVTLQADGGTLEVSNGSSATVGDVKVCNNGTLKLAGAGTALTTNSNLNDLESVANIAFANGASLSQTGNNKHLWLNGATLNLKNTLIDDEVTGGTLTLNGVLFGFKDTGGAATTVNIADKTTLRVAGTATTDSTYNGFIIWNGEGHTFNVDGSLIIDHKVRAQRSTNKTTTEAAATFNVGSTGVLQMSEGIDFVSNTTAHSATTMGTINVNGGTLAIGGTTTGSNATVNLANGAKVVTIDSDTTTAQVFGIADGATVTFNGNGSTLTLNGALNGASATVKVLGDVAMNGTVNVSGISGTGNLALNTALTVNTTSSIGSINGSGALTLNADLSVVGDVTIDSLTLNGGADLTTTGHSGEVTTSSLTVTADGSEMNANLVIADGGTLDFSSGAILTMGCDVTIDGSEVTVKINSHELASIQHGTELTLITGIDTLNLNEAITVHFKGENDQSLDGYGLRLEKSTDGFSLVVTPEPATATLSLLALAGLAARRRRH